MWIVQPQVSDHPTDFGCAQVGCRECVERLLRQHAGLIPYLVQRQCAGQADYADPSVSSGQALIREGWIGLWQAILHFDPERGLAFATLAGIAIRNRVWQAVRRAAKAEGGMEPQRAGDSLAVLISAWQQEQLHQGCRTN